MNTTRLSSKGQVVIPSATRAARKWKAGTELEVVEAPEGVLLRTVKRPFARSRLDEVFGIARYRGPKRSLAEMEAAVHAEAARRR